MIGSYLPTTVTEIILIRLLITQLVVEFMTKKMAEAALAVNPP